MITRGCLGELPFECTIYMCVLSMLSDVALLSSIMKGHLLLSSMVLELFPVSLAMMMSELGT